MEMYLAELTEKLKIRDQEVHLKRHLQVKSEVGTGIRNANKREELTIYAYLAALGMMAEFLLKKQGDPPEGFFENTEGLDKLLRKLPWGPISRNRIIWAHEWLMGHKITDSADEKIPTKKLRKQAIALIGNRPF